MAAKKTAKAPEKKNYATLAAILKDKAGGKLPRGSKMEIDTEGEVSLVDAKGERLSDTFPATDVAGALLAKLGFKVDDKNADG